MSDLKCKCGHAVSEHANGLGCLYRYADVDVCECLMKAEDFQRLHRAIVEAAMRYEDESGGHEERALFAAVRALKDATQ